MKETLKIKGYYPYQRMYKTLLIMGFVPYQLVSRISEPSTVAPENGWLKTTFLLGCFPGRCYVSFRECNYQILLQPKRSMGSYPMRDP